MSIFGNTYCKLTDGRVMIVWSDNTVEQTMNLYPVKDELTFEAEWDITEEVKYKDIAVTDTNRVVVENFKIEL